MEEEWRDVVGYEGRYQVSNLGRVGSLPNRWHRKFVMLKTEIDYDGYERVNLVIDKHRKRCSVHRLVAEAFISNPQNLPIINHKDENPMNNCVDNLEWCTQKYNLNYGNCRRKQSDSRSVPVSQFSIDGHFVRRWKSAKEASKALGVDASAVTGCAKGKRRTHGGYVWRYAE